MPDAEYDYSTFDLEENTDETKVAYSKSPLVVCSSSQMFRETLGVRLRENSFE
jgi:hypothetical protein